MNAMPMMPRPYLPLGLGLALLLGCGGDSAGPEPQPEPDAPLEVSLTADASGDRQVALRGTELLQPLRVVVTRNGSPVPGVEVSWSLTTIPVPGEATLVPGGPTGPDGIATARLQLGRAGAYRVLAGVSGGASSVRFNATAGSPTITFGGTRTGTVGSDLPGPSQLRVTWAGGPLVGEVLTGDGAGGVTIAGPTDADGTTEATIRLGTTAGAQFVSFKSAAVPSDPGLSVGLTAVPDVPAELNWTSFDPGIVGSQSFPARASFQVRDQFGNGVPNAAVSWRIVSGETGAIKSASPSTLTLGEAGISVEVSGGGAPLQLGATVAPLPESTTPALNPWHLRYTCWDWYGCWIEPYPLALVHQTGDPIRFDVSWMPSGLTCQAQPVGGGTHVPMNGTFTLTASGRYDVNCAAAGDLIGQVWGYIESVP